MSLATTTAASPHDQSVVQRAAPDDSIRVLVRMFKLLADETRLRILFYLLQRQELHVRALCDLLGQSQPAVSHHLALLRAADLIELRRAGKHNYYRVRQERFESLLDAMFVSVPQPERWLRFEEYVLNRAVLTR